MKALYKIAQLSKQAHHQFMNTSSARADDTALYIQMIEQARTLHPVIGLEKIYHLFKPSTIGRDAFINIGTLAGYALEYHKKTTFKGVHVIPYQNLLTDKVFNNINQVWATDITYYRIGAIYYYISMIMDLYSRKIVSCLLAASLHAEHSLKVLKKAIKSRVLPANHKLIHHSDKGTQYTSHIYTKLLKKNKIGISMCNSVFENTSMERLNGIIKNDYLIHWQPRSFSHLTTLLNRAVNNYNNCPHGQLGMLSPNQYEGQLQNVPLSQRTKLKVFTIKRSTIMNPDQLSLFDNQTFIS
jgi:putative transposase